MLRIHKEMHLPSNYQEVLVLNEYLWKTKISNDTIRKLVYLYSLGMEYYNNQRKETVEAFYRNKINKVLTNPEVIDYLDKNKIDLNMKTDLNLFPNYDKSKFRNMSAASRCAGDEPISSSLKKIKILTKEVLSEIIARKIREFDIRLEKIDTRISKIIVMQMENFENMKRSKPRRKKKEIKCEIETGGDRNEMEMEMDNIRIDDTTMPQSIPMSQPIPMRRRGSSIGQNQMLKEIEDYVERNMKEMNAAWEEWKNSYTPEIEEAEESGFPDIVEGLKEDLEGELENMAMQFEEQRLLEVESIRIKYSKKGSLKN